MTSRAIDGARDIMRRGSATSTTHSAIDQPITTYMTSEGVAGISLAVSVDERLVYVQQYGLARRQGALGPAVPLRADHRFRIASISKPITATAIMTLIEEGKLNASDTVFGPGGVLGTQFGTKPYGQDITSITVDQLLTHTVGGWANDGNDPMFEPSQMHLGVDALISWVLDNSRIANPGVWVYSNFGYCVLGRVIQEVAGMPYDRYVLNKVLTPRAITDMRIGGNAVVDPATSDEVVYHGQNGGNPFWQDPYGSHIRVDRMAAHGGWTATPVSLLRFMVGVDFGKVVPDMLGTFSLEQMFTPARVPDINGNDPSCGRGWFSETGSISIPVPIPLPLPFPRPRALQSTLLGRPLLTSAHGGTDFNDGLSPAKQPRARRALRASAQGMQQQVLRSLGRETIRHTRFLRVWHDGALPGTVAHLRCADLPHFKPSTDRRPMISVAVLANSSPTTDRAGQRLAGIVESIVADPPTSWPIDQPL